MPRTFKFDARDPVVLAVADRPSRNKAVRDDELAEKINAARIRGLTVLTAKTLNAKFGPTYAPSVLKFYDLGVYRNCLQVHGEYRCSYFIVGKKEREQARNDYASRDPPFPPASNLSFWGPTDQAVAAPKARSKPPSAEPRLLLAAAPRPPATAATSTSTSRRPLRPPLYRDVVNRGTHKTQPAKRIHDAAKTGLTPQPKATRTAPATDADEAVGGSPMSVCDGSSPEVDDADLLEADSGPHEESQHTPPQVSDELAASRCAIDQLRAEIEGMEVSIRTLQSQLHTSPSTRDAEALQWRQAVAMHEGRIRELEEKLRERDEARLHAADDDQSAGYLFAADVISKLRGQFRHKASRDPALRAIVDMLNDNERSVVAGAVPNLEAKAAVLATLRADLEFYQHSFALSPMKMVGRCFDDAEFPDNFPTPESLTNEIKKTRRGGDSLLSEVLGELVESLVHRDITRNAETALADGRPFRFDYEKSEQPTPYKSARNPKVYYKRPETSADIDPETGTSPLEDRIKSRKSRVAANVQVLAAFCVMARSAGRFVTPIGLLMSLVLSWIGNVSSAGASFLSTMRICLSRVEVSKIVDELASRYRRNVSPPPSIRRTFDLLWPQVIPCLIAMPPLCTPRSYFRLTTTRICSGAITRRLTRTLRGPPTRSRSWCMLSQFRQTPLTTRAQISIDLARTLTSSSPAVSRHSTTSTARFSPRPARRDARQLQSTSSAATTFRSTSPTRRASPASKISRYSSR